MDTSIRLAGVVVDVPRADHAKAVSFWSAAIGKRPATSDQFPDYAQFADVTPGCYLLVQAVGDDRARVHLDFATDDRDGAVGRLTPIGGTQVDRRDEWTVMRDPAGTTFCVCGGCEAGNG